MQITVKDSQAPGMNTSAHRMCGNQPAGWRKPRTYAGPETGGRMFAPYGAERHSQRRRHSVRRLRAGRHFGGHAGTALPDAVRCLRPGRDLASGVSRSRCDDPRRLLILGSPGDQLPEQRLRSAAQTAATVNHTIAAGAYEHIYMHPAQDHLKGLRLPRPGRSPDQRGPSRRSRYNKPVASTRTQRRR